MITDRHRLGPDWQARLVELVRAAAEGGVDLVQIRERGLDGGPLFELVRRCVDAVGATRTRIVVNDRVDVALAASAHGVHLPGGSMSPSRVRGLVGAEFLIGRSVHSEDDVRRANEEEGLDYLVFGTVFASTSKPRIVPAGVTRLAEAAAVTCLPVLAVGGMTPVTVGEIASTGASGFAAIGLFVDSGVDHVHAAVTNASAAFDAASRDCRRGAA